MISLDGENMIIDFMMYKAEKEKQQLRKAILKQYIMFYGNMKNN
jgi:hypothetical protein